MPISQPEVVYDDSEAWTSLAEANRQLTKFALENAELKAQLAEMDKQYREASKLLERALKTLTEYRRTKWRTPVKLEEE